MILLLVSALACRHKTPPDPTPPPPELPPTRQAPSPAGGFAQGRFQDAHGGFSVAVPDGWTAQIGQADERLRLTLRAASGTVLRAYAWDEAGCPMPDGQACRWSFSDSGPYPPALTTQPARVSTCTPEDPRSPHQQALLFEEGGRCWLFLAEVPTGNLYTAQGEVQQILETVELNLPEGPDQR